MAKVKDLKLNPPTKKSDLNKDSMLKFIKENGTGEDKEWFVTLMNNNKIKKKNNFTGEVGDGYDLPKVREEFAKRFFPEISSKAKNANKRKKENTSFEDQLAALLK